MSLPLWDNQDTFENIHYAEIQTRLFDNAIQKLLLTSTKLDTYSSFKYDTNLTLSILITPNINILLVACDSVPTVLQLKPVDITQPLGKTDFVYIVIWLKMKTNIIFY